MNDEKWLDLVDLIDDKFEVLDKTREEIPLGDDLTDNKVKEIKESLIFNGPVGKMKVERITRPTILDKKSHYSKRIGDKTRVEYEYSETEKTQKMKAYKWDEIQKDWVEIEAQSLSLEE